MGGLGGAFRWLFAGVNPNSPSLIGVSRPVVVLGGVACGLPCFTLGLLRIVCLGVCGGSVLVSSDVDRGLADPPSELDELHGDLGLRLPVLRVPILRLAGTNTRRRLGRRRGLVTRRRGFLSTLRGERLRGGWKLVECHSGCVRLRGDLERRLAGFGSPIWWFAGTNVARRRGRRWGRVCRQRSLGGGVLVFIELVFFFLDRWCFGGKKRQC